MTLDDIRRLLERAITGLPEHYRIVFVMRDVEEMSIEETSWRRAAAQWRRVEIRFP